MDEIIRHTDFQLLFCRAIIFTPDEQVSVPKVIKRLSDKWTKLFDADPSIIDLPQSASLPREIPKITFRNKDNTWSCEIASAFVAVSCGRPKPDEETVPIPEFFPEAMRLLLDYKEKLSVRVGRMSAIVNRFALNDDPGKYMATHFCKDEWVNNQPFNRPETFELNAHKTFNMTKEHKVNSWVRNFSRTIDLGSKKENAIIIAQEINTLAEHLDEVDYSEDQIKDFFLCIPTEIDKALSWYYPSESKNDATNA